MKIMGLDISSKSTGYAILEDFKLIEYGKIVPSGNLTHVEKLYLFNGEITKLLEKYKPDRIAIEDVVQVASVSITKILARFNGIALIAAYGYNKIEPKLYEPSHWKKEFGVSGAAKKGEIQLAVCEDYNLLNDDKITQYMKRIEEVQKLKEDLILLGDKKELEKLKKLKKSSEGKVVQYINAPNEIKRLKSKIENKIKEIKKKQKEMYDKISMDIYIDSGGINEDVADAVGVANCLQKELKEEKIKNG